MHSGEVGGTGRLWGMGVLLTHGCFKAMPYISSYLATGIGETRA